MTKLKIAYDKEFVKEMACVTIDIPTLCLLNGVPIHRSN